MTGDDARKPHARGRSRQLTPGDRSREVPAGDGAREVAARAWGGEVLAGERRATAMTAAAVRLGHDGLLVGRCFTTKTRRAARLVPSAKQPVDRGQRSAIDGDLQIRPRRPWRPG